MIRGWKKDKSRFQKRTGWIIEEESTLSYESLVSPHSLPLNSSPPINLFAFYIPSNILATSSRNCAPCFSLLFAYAVYRLITDCQPFLNRWCGNPLYQPAPAFPPLPTFLHFSPFSPIPVQIPASSGRKGGIRYTARGISTR